jgi:hypothetical protein
VAADALPLDPADCRRWQRNALIAGVAGLALMGLGWAIDQPAAVRSYLWAYLFFLGIALGSLALVLLNFLVGGVWGLIVRRVLEAATRTMPLLTLLFVPIVLSLPAVYIWAIPEVVAADHMLQHKAWYLNVPFYFWRAVGYFAIWNGLVWLLNRWSVAQDRPDAGDPRHLRQLGAGGLVLYGLTITFAAVDWIMSLEPHWFSTIFGPLIGVGQMLSALSFGIVVVVIFADKPPLAGVLGRPVFRDLGSLMLAFVMVWAYLGFSQYLLIWCGNLPVENPYYLRRVQGGWQYVALLLVATSFILPFVLLLSGDVKRTRSKLLLVAGLVLATRMLDQFWLVVPAQPGTAARGLGAVGFSIHWTDIAAPLGIGGIWLAVFLGQLQKQPLLPSHDPLLEEAHHHE